MLIICVVGGYDDTYVDVVAGVVCGDAIYVDVGDYNDV